MERGKRVLIYSHDTYGLGHLRRSLLIAEGVTAAPGFRSVLVATGSPRAQAFRLPQGCDTLKLPAVTKTGAGGYRSRTLRMPIDDLARLRAEMLRSVARSFRPDVILVDHAPAGMHGELRPLFDELRRWPRRPRLVLGLRDVIDDARRVRDQWDRVGAWHLLDELYDRVLVYGDPSVPSTADELGLRSRIPGKVTAVGYLGRTIPRCPDPADPFVLVTTGGGGDGHALLRSYLSYLERLPARAGFRSVLVSGPFLSSRREREVAARARDVDQPVEMLPFTDRFEGLLGRATGVVSMAGYNTVMEVLSAGVPALLVPREAPRLEQRIRAERLARVADVEWAPAERLDDRRIGRFVDRVMAGWPRASATLDMGGVARTVAELRAVVEDAAAAREGRTRAPAIA